AGGEVAAKQKLLLGPWQHSPWRSVARQPRRDAGPNEIDDWHLRFFDQVLKGEGTDVFAAAGPAFLVGGGWADVPHPPPPPTAPRGGQGRLPPPLSRQGQLRVRRRLALRQAPGKRAPGHLPLRPAHAERQSRRPLLLRRVDRADGSGRPRGLRGYEGRSRLHV